MRAATLRLYLFLAILLPKVGIAQVAYRPTPAPKVTAASAQWQINGEPIFFAGSFYYPAGPRVFFDGQVMARVGEYLTVPLYADTTQEPFSRVLVPVGGAVMKPYERRREGTLAGTTGSTTPSWPVEVASNTVEAPHAVGTSGAVSATIPTTEPAVGRTGVQSVPRPTANTGISVVFQGSRWVSAGPAVTFSPERFVPVGDHRGFPVYRDSRGSADTIYVTVVVNGPLAPYRRQ